MRFETPIAGSDAPQIERGSLRMQVTRRLLVDVFQGRLPSGQRLIAQQVADLYQVSPTPVRESLVELSNLGIVELLPNRGAVVRPFGPQQVREIGQIRRVLEVEGVRCACGRVEADALRQLETELVRLDGLPPTASWDRAIRAADTRLHGLFAESCASARLSEEIQRYLTLFRTLRDVSHQRDAWTHYARTNDVPAHLAIVRPMRRGNADEAAEAMDRHIRSATEVLVDVVFAGRDTAEGPVSPAGVAGQPGPSPPGPDDPPGRRHRADRRRVTR